MILYSQPKNVYSGKWTNELSVLLQDGVAFLIAYGSHLSH